MEHITTVSLDLEPGKGFDLPKSGACSLGPMLQSVLMEHADSTYVKQLHASVFNPYSQYCFVRKDGGLVWRVSALTDEAASRLLKPIDGIESFKLRNLDTTFSIARKTRETVSVQHLLSALKEDAGPTFRVHFMSPVAFKSKGEYVIVPDVRLVFQNLLMRYNQVYAGDSEIDADTVLYISEHTRITSYNLRSHYFPRTMSKNDKIPAFMGDLTLHVAGSQSLRGLVAMLLEFGEVSGVGAKTSMGMGGMQILEQFEGVNHRIGGSGGR